MDRSEKKTHKQIAEKKQSCLLSVVCKNRSVYKQINVPVTLTVIGGDGAPLLQPNPVVW